MKMFGNLCYALGIVVAIGVGMGLCVPYEQGKSVDGSVDCNTVGTYTKQNDCQAKPNRNCDHPRVRCRAAETHNSALCKSGEGGTACNFSTCETANNDTTSSDCAETR